MALDENNRARLDEFFADIARHSSAYQQDMFSYAAVKDGERWVTVVGSLVMAASGPTMAERSFECAVAKAGVSAWQASTCLPQSSWRNWLRA